MSAQDPAKKFAALVKRLRQEHSAVSPDAAHAHRPEHTPRLIWQLVFSLLAADCSPDRAAAPCRALHDAVVDYNELRVCLVEEIAESIGSRYPASADRAARIRAALNDIYRRHHAVTIDHLLAMNKREARAYLDALDGVTVYAAARVALLELDCHAMPVDERIRALLLAESALPPDLDADAASAWLERQLHAGEARDVYLLLEAAAATKPAPRSAPKPPRTEPRRAAAEPAKPKPAAKPKRTAKPKPA